ncbi:TonB-dependent receptor [Thalassotalea sp. HSM 43]|uniref:TonB-dependent receptor n=1 Tax=Thalassotalea sp. HSM 43 TaxID=2552945 RepID=UPI001082045C|nr:TonB-dependent receptor [Thalassotalea sp. HSM 43]QBY03570.1 TonB-dependent receptor [Thalassotalea sp. HSM 43]
MTFKINYFNRTFSRNKLSLAISTAFILVTTHSVNAAEQDQEKVEDEVEVIEVTGFRSSASKQRDFKRFSENISDGIFAEDMGKMPDENIAEAMQRITGVGIDRVDGEGSTVTIRGVDPSLNQININGVTMTNGGDDNAVNFSTMSADMLSSIEVIKSPSAHHDEGSLGGTVNLKTFRPLELNERKASVSVQTKQNELADETDFAVKGSFADKFANDNFGIATSVFYDEQTVRTDFYNMYNWKVWPNVSATSHQTGENLGKVFAFDPTGFETGTKFNERVRYGGSLTLEYRLDEDNRLWSDLSYSMLTVDEDLYQTRLTALRKDNILDEESGTSFYASSAKAGGNILSRMRETDTETINLGLGYETVIADWVVTAKVGISRADESWPTNNRLNFGQVKESASANWLDENGNIQTVPTLEWNNEYGYFDPTKARLFQIYDDDRSVKDDLDSISIDLQRDVEFGAIHSIQLGAKYFERSKDRSQTIGNTPFTKDSDGNFVYLNDVGQDFPINDFFDGVLDNALEGWMVPDFDYVYNTYLPNGFDGPSDLINTYTIDTEATAVYIEFNYSAFDGKLIGDFGVRYVDTTSSSKGHQGANFPAATGGDSYVVPVDASSDYTNVLPSFNARYVINEDMLLRFSAAKVMARPTPTQIRPGVAIKATNPDNVTAAGGNPYLDPTEATQFDISWEWYFADSGLLSIAGFYKDIDTFIFDKIEEQSFDCPTGTTPENCALLVDVPTKMSDNGSGGEITGAEVSYQQDFTFLPGFLSDFGTIINYTYTDSEASFVDSEETNAEFYDGFPFLKTSKDTVNATLYWEKDGHSVRLAYNYRSDNLYQAVVLDSSIWTDSRESLDLSANFQLTQQLSLNMSANNLTDESDRRYATRTIGKNGLASEGNALTSGTPDWRTAYYANTGRIFRVGVTYKF